MISIIVPVYNVECFLEECLTSIAAQTFNDFEVLMIDDCSPDHSCDIAHAFEEKDKRFRYIRRESNGGLSAARNTGLRQAKGDYIAFVDSDDRIEENYLAALTDAIEANGADVAVCAVTQLLLNGGRLRSRAGNHCFGRDDAIAEMLYQRSFDVSAWGKLYRRQAWDGLFFTEGILYEDLDIMYRVFERCGKIAYTDQTSYIYIHHKSSILRNGFNERHFDVLRAAERVMEHYSAAGGELYRAAVRRYVYSNFLLINMLLDSGSGRRDYFRMLRGNILRHRSGILCDRKARLSDKIGVIFISAGVAPFRFGMKVFRRARGVDNEQN